MIQLINGAFVWRGGMAIDADGSPNSYHSAPGKGLDYLANAGKSGNWWGIACDYRGEPYVQLDVDPSPGYYVSTTSLVDQQYQRRDPRRYVDSEQVPYVTMTRDMLRQGCRLGDVAMVFYGAAQCAAVVADVGPHPGEGSIALARELGIPSSPKHGGVDAPVVSYCIFSGSARGWPCTRESIVGRAEVAFGLWGGPTRLAATLGS